ncbi:MAG: cysteine desulfurase [Lactobacillales bacterium]|nr:cysteine desulfurase [Lactobacillales bacterium]
MIYFDHSATTFIFKEALDSYVKTSQRIIGNPASLHELGRVANHLLLKSRGSIANLLQVNSSEIYFTSGGTEGDNWILKGTAIQRRAFGNHLILSSIEHPAMVESAKQLESFGFDVDFVPVNKRGFIDLEKLTLMISKETIFVSVMAINNEIGSVQPIEEIARILSKEAKIHFHVDAVQAVGKIEKKRYLPERVDFATFSAHKFHGPRGVGFIYWKDGKRLAPLLTGGGQERGMRSGTENTPGIVAMAKALRLFLEGQEGKIRHLLALKEALFSSLQSYERIYFFTEITPDFSPHILTFGIIGVRGEVLVHALEEKQIFVSTTSACSSRKKASSWTLNAMKISSEIAETAIRISLDESNTMAEVEQFMVIFNQLYKKFRKIF